MPTPSSSRKLVAPAAQITRRVRIVPRSVTTPTTAPPAVSIAVTPQPSKKRAPASAARAANGGRATRLGLPSVAVNSPPSVRACGEAADALVDLRARQRACISPWSRATASHALNDAQSVSLSAI